MKDQISVNVKKPETSRVGQRDRSLFPSSGPCVQDFQDTRLKQIIPLTAAYVT